MTDGEKLMVLKQDLQRLTPANDAYLERLISLAQSAIQRMGVVLADDIECDMAVIHYAAYLFRKRATSDGAMPRFLVFEINNLLFSQKAGGVE